MKAFTKGVVLVIFSLTLACSFLGQSSENEELQSTISVMQTQLANQGSGNVEATPVGPQAGSGLTGGTQGATETGTVGAFTLLGQIGGSSYAVAVAGHYAYLGQGPRLVTLDLTNPGQPQLLDQSSVLPGIVLGVQVAGDYAYVVTRYGDLYVFDLQNPARPKLAGSLPLSLPGCQALEIKGNLAYLACNPGGLEIVDISNPQQPVEVSGGALPGTLLSIALAGDYAYLVDVTNHGLLVADVSNPSSPSQAGFFSVNDVPGSSSEGYSFSSVRVCGNSLCLAAVQDGLVVLDLSHPAQPAFAGRYDTSVATGLAVNGNQVYLVDDMDGLYVLDVSNPGQPALLGQMPTSVGGFEFSVTETSERGVFAQGNQVYVTDQAYGLTVVDARDAGNPTRIGYYLPPVPDVLQAIRVAGDYAYVVGRTSGFHIVDISNPSQLRQLSYDNSRKNLYLQNPTGLELVGKYAYISDSNYPFRVYDVSNPNQPVQTGAVFDPAASDGAYDVVVAGKAAYLSGWGLQDAFYPGDGLWVIDLSDPSQPLAAQFVDLPNERWQLATDSHYLYALDGSVDAKQSEPLSLRILDISQPLQPTEVNQIAIEGAMPLGLSDILLDDGFLYVSLPPQGLKVFDLSNPTQPVEVASPSFLMGMNPKLKKTGNNLFVAGTMAYDLTDPQQPQLAGYANNVFESWDCAVVGDRIYVITKFHGLYVFQFQP